MYLYKYLKYKNKYLAQKNKYQIGGNIDSTSDDITSSEINTDDSNENLNGQYQKILYEIAKFLKPNIANKFLNEFGIKQLSNQVIELNKITYLTDLYPKITDYYITDKIDGKRTILYLTNNNSYAVSDKLELLKIKTENICILDTEKYDNDYYIFDVMVINGKNIIEEPFEERKKNFEYFERLPNIKLKPFIKLTENYKEQIHLFKLENKPYDVDGIIFTPSDGLYDTMKVYKYKPPEQLTIDFLIKKDPFKNGKAPGSAFGVYYLLCGVAKNVFFKLRLRFVNGYDKIFPNINRNNLPQYFPIHFQPSSNKHAYYFNSNDANLDGQVGEFIYDMKTKSWILKKIRYDRKIEVERGNYFGNNYKIAEFIWMAYSDPLNIENIDDSKVYFQEHDNVLQKSSRNFNSFVKSEIFKTFRNSNWVMDMASGKGQDLFRYAANDIKNVIFLEIDKTALTELITRKFAFSVDKKYRTAMNILIQNVDLLDPYKKNIELIHNNIYNLSNDIDVIVCNFAFHYLIGTQNSLENICKFINYYLKTNGKFIFTAFDGQKIVDLLKNNGGSWIIRKDDQIKYGIKKKYNGDNLDVIGQKIDVLLPFSKNTFYEEYLVNINTIQQEFKKYGIILESNKSFSSYIPSYDGSLDDNDKTYVDLYHCYVFKKM